MVIGQAPGPRTNGRPALDGPSGDRLAALVGLRRDELLAGVEARNLVGRWPGRSGGKGCAFPAALGRRNARRMAPRLRGRRVLLLGRHVANAFGVDAPFLEWTEHDGASVCVFPHPSGISHWWNDRRNKTRAARVLSAALEGP